MKSNTLLIPEAKDQSVVKFDSGPTEETWVEIDSTAIKTNDHQLRINKSLYEKLGIIAFVTSYSISTHVIAAQFANANMFMLSNTCYRYGTRAEIEKETDWKTTIPTQTDKLFNQLQAIANIGVSEEIHQSRSLTKNTNMVLALSKPQPLPYLPLMLNNGTLENGLPDDYALRINPSLSKDIQQQKIEPFKKYIFSFFMFGSDITGKKLNEKREFEEKSILTEVSNLEESKMVLSVSMPGINNFLEESQFQTLNLLIPMMKRLGQKEFDVVCNLHYIDYLLYGLLLYLQEKISKFAFRSFIKAILKRKEIIEKKLLELFQAQGISTFTFSSSLENVINIEALAKADDPVENLLAQLDLGDQSPDSDEDNHEVVIFAAMDRLFLPDIRLIFLNRDQRVSGIEDSTLHLAQANDTPILIKKEKRVYLTPDQIGQPQLVQVYYLYGDREGNGTWQITEISTPDKQSLDSISFKSGILENYSPLYTYELIDILKEYHVQFRLPRVDHLPYWNSFQDVSDAKKIQLKTLNQFFNLADAVTIAIATDGMQSSELCSIESSSRKNIQDIESLYTTVGDKLCATRVGIDYCIKSRGPRFPQRSYIDYTKHVPTPFTEVSTRNNYPVVFFISYIDLYIGSNLSKQPNEAQNNTAVYFKDTEHKNALSLVKLSMFNKKAAHNAAVTPDPRHTSLGQRMVPGLSTS